MKDFNEKMIESIQHAILKQVQECRYVEYHHKNKKYVPDDIIEKAWLALNWEFIPSEVTKNLEQRLITVISQNMMTEAATDAKKTIVNSRS